jgi:type VI secretion system protein
MRPTRRTLLAMPLLLGGCSSLFGPDVRVRRIAITVAPGANGNAPIALDLVHVSDRPPLATALGELTGAEWFERRAQFRRDWPRDLEIRSWEVVPGQILAEERLPSPAVGAAALLFALYQSPGTHRARLARGGQVTVQLQADEMQVEEA